MLSRERDAGFEVTRQLFPLALRAVTYAAGAVRLLDIPQLVIEAGPRTVIMGANGAGKSLLLRLMHGLIDPSSGSITWNGMPVEATRTRQGFAAQRPVLLRRSATANIRFALGAALSAPEKAERVAKALQTAQLQHRARTPARLLSGGEQQRLAIARALVRRPEVLLLDEPTASLDPASTHAVESMISAASQAGVKIILVTHDIGQARRLAEEIVFLHGGKLAEQTPAAAFFSKPRSDAAQAYLDGRLHIEEQQI